LFADALSTWRTLEKEAGTTTDDPHHPARTLPDNVYTIYGVVASINRYILRLLMQKARILSGPVMSTSKEKPERSCLARAGFRISWIRLLLCASFCPPAVQAELPFAP
jgi:hypothetical protein